VRRVSLIERSNWEEGDLGVKTEPCALFKRVFETLAGLFKRVLGICKLCYLVRSRGVLMSRLPIRLVKYASFSRLASRRRLLLTRPPRPKQVAS
jgi:hypothetical protein